MMDITGVLVQWFIIFFNKKTEGGAVKNEILENQALAEELHEPIIRRFEKRKVHSSFFVVCCVLFL